GMQRVHAHNSVGYATHIRFATRPNRIAAIGADVEKIITSYKTSYANFWSFGKVQDRPQQSDRHHKECFHPHSLAPCYHRSGFQKSKNGMLRTVEATNSVATSTVMTM